MDSWGKDHGLMKGWSGEVGQGPNNKLLLFLYVPVCQSLPAPSCSQQEGDKQEEEQQRNAKKTSDHVLHWQSRTYSITQNGR